MSTTLGTQITVSPILVDKDLHTPFSGKPARSKISGLITKILDEQQVAATANQYHVVRQGGALRRVLIGVATLCASTETMTIDIKQNGTSIFTGGTTVEAVHTTTTVGLYDVTGLCIAATVFAVGDIIEVVRTLANGSTFTESDVSIEIAG